ncbi:winged helix-turn-helix transcriptional regulator [Nocardia sp. JMUB6875]|uniref:winged helix-turn-helix transcriptional regulator n=1 Tax=Nocardia sp. JMUB6875 TaxID=3158170 RepID=UPI0032E6FCF7
MSGYGQFCSIARALEVLGERWSLLIVRELLLGERRFGDIQRGIPRISKTMLSTRLKELERAGVLARDGDGYALTEAGQALTPLLKELGGWAARWDPRGLLPEHLDPDALLWDLHRRLVPENLPTAPTLVEFRFTERDRRPYYLLARRPDVTVCDEDGGHPVALHIEANLEALTRYWLGEVSWAHLLREHLITLTGPAALRRAFPTWFSGYLLAAEPA